MIKDIILNDFATSYLICDISKSLLFAKKVWDMNPYPSTDSNDFRALRLSEITSNGIDDSSDSIQHFFEFELESSGKDAHIKLLLKASISCKIRKNASIKLKIKGKYGLAILLTINIYTIDFFVSVDSTEVFAYRNRKQKVAKLIYGYRGHQQNVVTNLYSGVQKYRYSIIAPKYIAFKDNANDNFVFTFDAEISAATPSVTANLFLIEKPKDISTYIIVKVERLIGERIVDKNIITQSSSINFIVPLSAKLEIKPTYISSGVYISPNETKLLRLELINTGVPEADAISLHALSCQGGNPILRFEPTLLPVIYPENKVTIDVFLKAGKVKSLLEENVKATINFVYKNQALPSESRTIELITQGESYISTADMPVRIKGQRSLEIATVDYDYYPTDQVLSGTVELKTQTSESVNNVFVWLKEDNKDFLFDDNKLQRLVFENINGLSSKTINFSIALNENVQEKYTIVVAADYCEILEKSFHITKKIPVKAKAEVLFIEKHEKKCYLGGHSKVIAGITVENNTDQETDSRKAESLNLSRLKIKDNAGKNINGVIITDEQGNFCDDSVLPMAQINLIIKYDPQRASDRFVGKIELYYNNVKVNLPKPIEISINKRELSQIPSFKFDPVPNCRYEISDFIVGSIHIIKDEVNVDCYIPRTYERFVINDDSKKAYYFLFENGQTTTELNITSSGTISCKLVAVAKECLNDEIRCNIPVSYCCDENNDSVPMDDQISIFPNEEKPCFEFSVQDRADYRTLIDLNKKESVKIKCLIDMNTELAKIFVLKLFFVNKASIPYKDWGVKISKLKIGDKNNKISYYDGEEQFCLFNGSNELIIPICVPQEIIRKRPCSISVFFKYDDKLIDRSIDIEPQWVTRDGWVSLDLGTSGIVMAKLHKEPSGSVVDILELTDAEKDPKRCIESDSKIISSSIILNKEREVIFCPPKTDFKRALFQIVPIKFIIGQENIPFKSNLVMALESLQASSSFFINKEECAVEISGLPNKIVDFVYEDILRKRINKEHVNSITKFILTYPNTYVPKQLAVIRKNLEDIMFPNIVPIEFVPESDAIVAHYLKMRLQGHGFKTAREIGKEKIVIYDMGAGTLDISYVELVYDAQEQQYTATICNRVGAPLGGNYLDALFYNYLEDKLELQGDSEREQLLNARDFIWFLKTRCSDDNLGRKISDIIKLNNDEKDEKGKNKNEQINVVLNDKSSSVSLSDLLSDSTISRYISLCTESILFYMLNQARNYKSNLRNQKEWLREQVDTIVLSGRGSQFVPIRKKLEEIFTIEKLDDNTIIDDIKTGVAKGAIEYCQIIGSRNQYRFSIRNQNQYLRIGIIYNGVNEFDGLEKKYVECIDPTQVNWADIIPENGTRYMTFNNTVILNLRRVESICFVQTVLPVSEVEPILTQPTHIHWSLINELFTIRINEEFVDPESVEVNIQIDKNSQVIIKMNGDEYLPLSGLENIELNKCYAMSAWPFNKPLR